MTVNNYKQRLLFRADGNSTIGLGHIYRCLAMIERLNNTFECYFAICSVPEQLKFTISLSAQVVDVNIFDDIIAEAINVATIVNDFKINYLVLDGYSFNTDYQKIIKKSTSVILISIDDDQPFYYVSDRVINHAGSISTNDIPKSAETKTFLGYDYLMLRKQFIDLLLLEKKIITVNSILICFGGADPDDFTGRILKWMQFASPINKITVVVGSAYQKINQLTQLIKNKKDIEIKVNISVEDLAKLMYETDIAIVPASTVSLEAFVAKMIIITGMTSNNQKYIYDGLVKEEIVIGIGDFTQLTQEKLLEVIDQIRSRFKNSSITPQLHITDSLLNVFKNA